MSTVATVLGLSFALTSGAASADSGDEFSAQHTGQSHIEVCDGVLASFKSFPQGTNVVTITGATSIDKSFDGTAGQVTARWDEIGVDTTLGGVHTVTYTWKADGGGTYGPFSFDADENECVPPPTVPNPVTLTATSTCINDHTVEISGVTSGFDPNEEVIVVAYIGDGIIDYSDTTAAPNGPYKLTVLADEFLENGKRLMGIIGYQYESGLEADEVVIEVDFNCTETTTTTAAPTTTVPPATTAPPTTAPPTTQGPQVLPPTPTTMAPTTQLPSTGSGTGTMLAISIGLVAIGFVVTRSVRRRRQGWLNDMGV